MPALQLHIATQKNEKCVQLYRTPLSHRKKTNILILFKIADEGGDVGNYLNVDMLDETEKDIKVGNTIIELYVVNPNF